ncbi:MAG TPA: hypothetical protein VHN80_29910, partial [Kineosporiaceae bacterium]|nr:hypothetical protein [Kineosporiaceae bacterium]
MVIPVIAAQLLAAAGAASGAAPGAGVSPPHRTPPKLTGYPAVAPPPVTPPAPLGKHTGTVALNPTLKVRPGPPAGAATSASTSAAAAAAPVAAAAVATNKVAVRALVVAVDSTDFGVPTWNATLDQVGAAHDVLYTRTTP